MTDQPAPALPPDDFDRKHPLLKGMVMALRSVVYCSPVIALLMLAAWFDALEGR